MRLITTGELADRIGVPIKNLDYFIRSRRMQATDRAGMYRLWDEKMAAEIANVVEHSKRTERRGRPKTVAD